MKKEIRFTRSLSAHPLTILIAVVGFLFLCLMIKIIFFGSSTGQDVLYETSSESTSQHPEATTERPVMIIQGSNSIIAEMDIGEQVAHSSLVCSAEYVGESDSFMIQPVNGAEPTLFTDYYFIPREIYAGELHSSDDREDSLAVRQRGGESRYIEEINDVAASFEMGKEYLLFLYQIKDGSFYNTTGNHYYLTADMQSSWIEVEDGYWNEALEQHVSFDVLRSIDFDSNLLSSLEQYPATKELESINELHLRGEIDAEYYQNVSAGLMKEQASFASIMSEKALQAYENARVSEAREFALNLS